jgi:flagellar basal body-associated protein FliL
MATNATNDRMRGEEIILCIVIVIVIMLMVVAMVGIAFSPAAC